MKKLRKRETSSVLESQIYKFKNGPSLLSLFLPPTKALSLSLSTIQFISKKRAFEGRVQMGRHSCCYKQKLRKGLWSPEEDEKLLNYITKHGHGCWSSVPKLAGIYIYYLVLVYQLYHIIYVVNFISLCI